MSDATPILVPVVHAPQVERGSHPNSHHYAPFLAQLVATKQGHPQTRERRRVEPHEALAAYRRTASRLFY